MIEAAGTANMEQGYVTATTIEGADERIVSDRWRTKGAPDAWL
jgi:hypothetical protein